MEMEMKQTNCYSNSNEYKIIVPWNKKRNPNAHNAM